MASQRKKQNRKEKPDRKEIRTKVRQARREVPAPYRATTALRMSTLISEQPEYVRARTIAGFLPFDGEADPVPLLERAWLEKKRVFLPILRGKANPMVFAPYTRDSRMVENGFGILEPQVNDSLLIDPRELDLVITPLVGFDEQCNRIGVGGGFYDRTFAFLNPTSGESRPDKPALIGLAFELQKIPSFPTHEHDIPLDGVVTESEVYRAPRK